MSNKKFQEFIKQLDGLWKITKVKLKQEFKNSEAKSGLHQLEHLDDLELRVSFRETASGWAVQWFAPDSGDDEGICGADSELARLFELTQLDVEEAGPELVRSRQKFTAVFASTDREVAAPAKFICEKKAGRQVLKKLHFQFGSLHISKLSCCLPAYSDCAVSLLPLLEEKFCCELSLRGSDGSEFGCHSDVIRLVAGEAALAWLQQPLGRDSQLLRVFLHFCYASALPQGLGAEEARELMELAQPLACPPFRAALKRHLRRAGSSARVAKELQATEAALARHIEELRDPCLLAAEPGRLAGQLEAFLRDCLATLARLLLCAALYESMPGPERSRVQQLFRERAGPLADSQALLLHRLHSAMRAVPPEQRAELCQLCFARLEPLVSGLPDCALQLADLLSAGCRQGLLSGGGVLLFKDWRALLSAPKKCSSLRAQLESMRTEYRQAGPERLAELFEHLLAELAGLDNRRPAGGGASGGGLRISARWEKRAKKAARRTGLAVRLLRSVRADPAAAEFWRRLAACLPRGCQEAFGLLRELALLPPDFVVPTDASAESAAVAAAEADVLALSVPNVSPDDTDEASVVSAVTPAAATTAVVPSELQLCLTRLWRGELSQPAPDLLVTAGGERERKFRVHSLVLAGRCPWIRRVLQSGMCEALERHLRLPDCDGPLVERLLEFLYTGVLPVGDDASTEWLVDLLLLADRFELERLSKICASALVARIGLETAVPLLAVGERTGQAALTDAALDFLQQNGGSVPAEELNQLSQALRDRLTLTESAGSPDGSSSDSDALWPSPPSSNFEEKLVEFRAIVGPEPSDRVLLDLLVTADGDLNRALNYYLS